MANRVTPAVAFLSPPRLVGSSTRRYLNEADPSLADVAAVAGLLAGRALLMRGQ
jgi:hypothetical protein